MANPPDLTMNRIDTLEARAKPYDTPDGAVRGLEVRTHPTGDKLFYYRYRRRSDRRQQRVQIGLVEIGLAAARRIALKLAAEVAGGGDPAGRRRAERHAATAARQAADVEASQLKVRRVRAYLLTAYALHAEAEQKRGDETVARLQAAFRSFLDLDLADITLQMVKDWRAARLKSGIASTTVDREVGMLGAFVAHAVQAGVLLTNPLKGLKPLVSGKATINRVRFLDEDEEPALRAALRQRDADKRTERESMNRWLAARSRPALPVYPNHFVDHVEPVVLVLLGTGLRFGELTHLRWGNVNFPSRMLIVDGDTAKSGTTRHVPMPSEVLSLLSRWRTRSRGAPMDLVFPGKAGRPLVDIKTAWAAILRRAAIERFRVHDLRHSYASRLVQRGVSLFTVQKLLGHASPTMTMRYAHLAPDHLADAIAVLDQPPSVALARVS